MKTKILAIDFTKDKDIQERVEAEIKDLNIGVLVNNVGVSYDHPEYFLQIGIMNKKDFRYLYFFLQQLFLNKIKTLT